MQLAEVLKYLWDERMGRDPRQEVLSSPYLTEFSKERIRKGGLDAMLRQLEQNRNPGVDMGQRRDTLNGIIAGL